VSIVDRGEKSRESARLGGVERKRKGEDSPFLPLLPLSDPSFRSSLFSLTSQPLPFLSLSFSLSLKNTNPPPQYASDTLDTHQSMKRTIRKSKQVVEESESEEEEEIVVSFLFFLLRVSSRERERDRKKNEKRKQKNSPLQKKLTSKKKLFKNSSSNSLSQEYVAHPYNADVELGEEIRAMFAPVPADTVLPSQIPEGYNFRKYDRKTKKNWGGIAAVTFYCLSLILYFFVRVTKTMDLGRYMFYGVVVFFIEVSVTFFFFGGGGGEGEERQRVLIFFLSTTLSRARARFSFLSFYCFRAHLSFFSSSFSPHPNNYHNNKTNRCAEPPPLSSTAPTWCWTRSPRSRRRTRARTCPGWSRWPSPTTCA